LRFEDRLPKGWKPYSLQWLPSGVVYAKISNPAAKRIVAMGAGWTVEEAIDEAVREANT
jgi:hypothetical protein